MYLRNRNGLAHFSRLLNVKSLVQDKRRRKQEDAQKTEIPGLVLETFFGILAVGFLSPKASIPKSVSLLKLQLQIFNILLQYSYFIEDVSICNIILELNPDQVLSQYSVILLGSKHCPVMVKVRYDLFTYSIIGCNTSCTKDHIISIAIAKLAVEVQSTPD